MSVSVLVAAASCYFLLLIGAGTFYVRSINRLADFLKLKNPEAWRFLLTRYAPESLTNDLRTVRSEAGLTQIVLGIGRLKLNDVHYDALLWGARRSLIATAILFAVGVFAVGYLFQGTSAPRF